MRVNKLSKAITDAKNFDVIINKLSEIMTAESVEKYIQTLIEYGLLKGVDNIWD